MVSSIQGLAPITNPLNSVLIEKKLINVDQKFIQLVSLAEGLPRTEVIESGRNYWRGVCRSLIFRFPDDLEILKLDVRSYVDRSKGIIIKRSNLWEKFFTSFLSLCVLNRLEHLYRL